MRRNRRFFYLLIFLSIVAALFYSTLLGLIVLIGAIIYYYVLGRQPGFISSVSTTNSSNVNEKPSSSVPELITCKTCSTLFDPLTNNTCPTCGAAP